MKTKEKKAKNKSQKEMMREKGFITATAAARLVGKSLQSVYYWIDDEKVESARIDVHRYVKLSSLVEFYRSQDPASVALLGLDKVE